MPAEGAAILTQVEGLLHKFLALDYDTPVKAAVQQVLDQVITPGVEQLRSEASGQGQPETGMDPSQMDPNAMPPEAGAEGGGALLPDMGGAPEEGPVDDTEAPPEAATDAGPPPKSFEGARAAAKKDRADTGDYKGAKERADAKKKKRGR